MSEGSFLKRRWKLLLNIVTVGALLLLAYAVRHQLAETLGNLDKVNLWVLLLLLPVEWLNYMAQAKLYQSLFAVVGNQISYSFLFKAALELNFVNNVFPSAGVSGISYFGMRMRSKEITGGKATVVQMMKLMLLFLSFEVLLIAGLFFLALRGHVNNVVMLVCGSLSTLLVVGTVAFTMIVGSERRIAATFRVVARALNRAVGVFRPNRPEVISTKRARHLVEELHGNYKVMAASYKYLARPFWWALLANLSEVLAVYVVYVAFGKWVNFGAVILAYSVANFAGLISVLPGGVGVYEALMTVILAATGVPAAKSIPVTIMYRILNMLVQLPPGYYYYPRTVISGKSVAPHA